MVIAQEKRDYYEVLGVSKTATDADSAISASKVPTRASGEELPACGSTTVPDMRTALYSVSPACEEASPAD